MAIILYHFHSSFIIVSSNIKTTQTTSYTLAMQNYTQTLILNWVHRQEVGKARKIPYRPVVRLFAAQLQLPFAAQLQLPTYFSKVLIKLIIKFLICISQKLALCFVLIDVS